MSDDWATVRPRVLGYRPDIDGMRALAVVAVIGFHAFPSVVRGGFVGVDVFFVISGYLITGAVLKQEPSGAFSFLDFYARRLRRLVPALSVVLLGTLLLGAWVLLADELNDLALHAVAAAAFIGNVLLWQQAGYFDAAADAKPLLHLWSLAVEWQFYLLWPPMLVLSLRRGVNTFATMALLTAASFALNLWLVQEHAAAAFYLLPTRLWELLAGGLLAQHEGSVSPRSAVRNGLSLSGLVLLLAAIVWLRAGARVPGLSALAPTAATLLLIAAGADSWLNRALLSRTPMVAIGLVSYPLYLWHWPLLSFARITEQGEPAAAIRVASVAVTSLLAILTWRFVERPAQAALAFGAARRRVRRAVVASIISLALLAAFGGTIRASHGAPGWQAHRFSGRAAQLHDLAPIASPATAFPRCTGPLALAAGSEPANWCNTSNATDDLQIALLGDSHTLYLFPGLAQAFGTRGINSLVMGHSSCAPLLGVRSFLDGTAEECSAANARMVTRLSQRASVHTVILSALGPYYFSGTSVAAAHTGFIDAAHWRLEPIDAPGLHSKRALFEAGYSRTISQLESAGKRVVFFLDVPELDFQPASCISARPVQIRRGARAPCGMSVDAVNARQAEYRAIVARLQIAHPRLRVFDPLPLLCDQALCSALHDGRFIYRDSHHLSPYGAAYLSEHLARWLEVQADAPR